MFSHVMVGVEDMDQSKKFYDAVLAVLDCAPGGFDDKGRCFYLSGNGVFALTKPLNGEAACHGNGSTIGFSAKSTDVIDAWHAVGLANGGVSCEDAPGWRESPMGKLYLAYLRDPTGNKICAMHSAG